MPLHLLKMAVGCDSVADLREWQGNRLARGEPLVHRTRNKPRRNNEVLDGGSLYWIVRGRISVRQRITALDTLRNDEGVSACLIGLDPDLIDTVPTPCRPMQGWRYLVATDAPPDLGADTELPVALIQELKLLGLV